MKITLYVESSDNSGVIVSRRTEVDVAVGDLEAMAICIANFAKDVALTALADTLNYTEQQEPKQPAASSTPVKADVVWAGEAKGKSKYGY